MTTERRVRMYFTGPEPQPVPKKTWRIRRAAHCKPFCPVALHVWAISMDALCRPVRRVVVPGKILFADVQLGKGSSYNVFAAGGETNWALPIEKKYLGPDGIQAFRYYRWKSRDIVLVVPTEEDRFADFALPFPSRLVQEV